MVPPSVVTPVMAECRRAPPVAPRHRLACAHCRQMRILFSLRQLAPEYGGRGYLVLSVFTGFVVTLSHVSERRLS